MPFVRVSNGGTTLTKEILLESFNLSRGGSRNITLTKKYSAYIMKASVDSMEFTGWIGPNNSGKLNGKGNAGATYNFSITGTLSSNQITVTLTSINGWSSLGGIRVYGLA